MPAPSHKKRVQRWIPNTNDGCSWVLPGGWAAVWLILHVLRPTAFPLLGIIAGVIIIPLLIAKWIEQRNAAGTAEQKRDDRHDEHLRR